MSHRLRECFKYDLVVRRVVEIIRVGMRDQWAEKEIEV